MAEAVSVSAFFFVSPFFIFSSPDFALRILFQCEEIGGVQSFRVVKEISLKREHSAPFFFSFTVFQYIIRQTGGPFDKQILMLTA
jgi:hypothetical protein